MRLDYNLFITVKGCMDLIVLLHSYYVNTSNTEPVQPTSCDERLQSQSCRMNGLSKYCHIHNNII